MTMHAIHRDALLVIFVNFLSFSLLSRAHVYQIHGRRQSPLLMLFPVELEVGDDPAAWESAGFTVDAGFFAGFCVECER